MGQRLPLPNLTPVHKCPNAIALGRTASILWGGRGDKKFAMLENSNFNFWQAQTRVLKSTLAGFTKIGETTADDLDVRFTFDADGVHTTTTTFTPPPPKK
jgi:hypothetical protein